MEHLEYHQLYGLVRDDVVQPLITIILINASSSEVADYIRNTIAVSIIPRAKQDIQINAHNAKRK